MPKRALSAIQERERERVVFKSRTIAACGFIEPWYAERQQRRGRNRDAAGGAGSRRSIRSSERRVARGGEGGGERIGVAPPAGQPESGTIGARHTPRESRQQRLYAWHLRVSSAAAEIFGVMPTQFAADRARARINATRTLRLYHVLCDRRPCWAPRLLVCVRCFILTMECLDLSSSATSHHHHHHHHHHATMLDYRSSGKISLCLPRIDAPAACLSLCQFSVIPQIRERFFLACAFEFYFILTKLLSVCEGMTLGFLNKRRSPAERSYETSINFRSWEFRANCRGILNVKRCNHWLQSSGNIPGDKLTIN